MDSRHILPSVLLAGLLLLPSACSKEGGPTKEVKLYLWHNPSTKTSAVTQLSNVFWGTTTGGNNEGSIPETLEWAASSASVTGQTVSTGRYLDAGDPGTRNYYVSNVDFTLGSAAMLNASNSIDIVAGRVFDCSTSTPSVTLHHIFARLGALTLNPPAGYTISGISWWLRGKTQPYGTEGCYNLTDGSWSACSGLASATPVSSGSDLYLIPGTYTLLCQYTLSRYGQSQVVSAQAEVTLQEGKIHHITGTAVSSSLIHLVLSVDIVPWGQSYQTQEDS